MNTLRSENQQLERQLQEARLQDGGRGGQVGALERALQQEKEGRERAISDAKELKRQLDLLNIELLEARRNGARADANSQVILLSHYDA